jgi:hypothetical protein
MALAPENRPTNSMLESGNDISYNRSRNGDPYEQDSGLFTTSEIRSVNNSDKSSLSSGNEKYLPESSVEELCKETSVKSAEDIVTKVLHADDDSSLNPWTFRIWFIGLYSSHMPYFTIKIC